MQKHPNWVCYEVSSILVRQQSLSIILSWLISHMIFFLLFVEYKRNLTICIVFKIVLRVIHVVDFDNFYPILFGNPCAVMFIYKITHLYII